MFYVFNVDINLLFKIKLCVNELKIFLNKNDLYLHDKYNKQIFKTSNRQKFSIANKIIFQLNDYVLTASIIFKTIVMSTLINWNDNDIMNLFKLIISSDNHSFIFNGLSLSNQTLKIDMYKLWHKEFAYLKFAKFKNFHQIFNFKKIISIVKIKVYVKSAHWSK